MDIKCLKKINKEVHAGDYSSFDNLSELDKGTVMKNWDNEMKHKYLTRNPVMSEEEFFETLDEIADGTYGREEI